MTKKKKIEEMAECIPQKLWSYNIAERSAEMDKEVRGLIAEHLYRADYRKQSEGEWISVEERLPEEGKYVIVWVGSVQVARIEKGITEEDRQKMKNGEVEDGIEYGWSLSTGFIPLKRSDQYKSCDVFGNNLVPYCWKANGGPMEWFGQNVTHWMPIPEAPMMKGGAE